MAVMDASPTGFEDDFESFASMGNDLTPQGVALLLIVAAGILYALKKSGFRFNFGVSVGR